MSFRYLYQLLFVEHERGRKRERLWNPLLFLLSSFCCQGIATFRLPRGIPQLQYTHIFRYTSVSWELTKCMCCVPRGSQDDIFQTSLMRKFINNNNNWSHVKMWDKWCSTKVGLTQLLPHKFKHLRLMKVTGKTLNCLEALRGLPSQPCLFLSAVSDIADVVNIKWGKTFESWMRYCIPW